MREYTIVRTNGAVDWANVPTLPIDALLWSPPVDITASAQLCYDDSAIYIRMSAVEAHIRAEETDRLGSPCLDSCLEFFFCPIPGDERYFNFEYNPNACLCFGFGGACRVRLVVSPELLNPKVTMTADGWNIEYKIPLVLIQQFVPEFQAVSGKSIRANCYKCGNLTVQRHYFSWNPVELPKPSFHCPPHFGIMYFE